MLAFTHFHERYCRQAETQPGAVAVQLCFFDLPKLAGPQKQQRLVILNYLVHCMPVQIIEDFCPSLERAGCICDGNP